MFGWFDDTLSGIEQESGYSVMAGYQKGPSHSGENWVFSIIANQQTSGLLLFRLSIDL